MESLDRAEQLIDLISEKIAMATCQLSAWESDFLDSVMGQWENKKWLSPKQVTILEKIWDKLS